MTRIIAFYLPQYHPVPENDTWWGRGFTEWVNVAQARPLFKGHRQPHIPRDLGFYDLRMPEVREAQAALARQAGIEGFCYWHYWFGNGKRLLERPFNEVVASGKPHFPFCLAWANHSWEKKLWDKEGSRELLMEQTYPGEKDYVKHFEALLPAFKDSRYVRVAGKLLFVIFDPHGSQDIPLLLSMWRQLAKQNGLNDFYFVAKDAASRARETNLAMGFDAIYNDDVFNIHHHRGGLSKVLYWAMRQWLHRPTVFQYRKAIEYMISDDCRQRNVIPVVAPNWDHSPRSGGKAIILHNSRPEYFKRVVEMAVDAVKDKPRDEQLIFLKSWNEWGEGNYIEPDLEHGRAYLDVLREVMGSAGM